MPPPDAEKDIHARFLAAIQESRKRTLDSGPRSTSRIKALHGWVITELRSRLDRKYKLYGHSDDEEMPKEQQVEGWYYPKNVDVSVNREGIVIGVISIKFINSNFRQNANNYFEQQMGETVNLRRSNIVFGHIFCATEPIPYYTRSGDLKKDEHILPSDVEKYYKLLKDHQHLHSPDVQTMAVFKLDEKRKKIIRLCTKSDMPQLDDTSWDKLNQMDIGKFFTTFVSGVNAKFEAVKE